MVWTRVKDGVEDVERIVTDDDDVMRFFCARSDG